MFHKVILATFTLRGLRGTIIVVSVVVYFYSLEKPGMRLHLLTNLFYLRTLSTPQSSESHRTLFENVYLSGVHLILEMSMCHVSSLLVSSEE